MAQGIALISGSPLIGSPISLRIVPTQPAQDYPFHRVVVKVYAGLETDVDFSEFDFSKQVEVNSSGNVQSMEYDISSALQAVADKYEYEAMPPSRYPYIKFRVEAWDEWMVDGNISTNQGVVKWPTNTNASYQFFAYAFMGSWTDMERMKANESEGVELLNTSAMSRKPTSSPEVVFLGNDFIYPAQFINCS